MDREDTVLAAAEKVQSKGGLDVLILNAGYGLMGALEDTTVDDIRAQMETNFLGAVSATRALLPSLRARSGRILVMSSAAGRAGIPYYAAYNASKFAMEGFFDALRYELEADGIDVCLVEPGGFRTSAEPREAFVGKLFWNSPRNRAANELFAANLKRQYGSGGDPLHVARLMLRLARARSVPMRRPIGWDAWGLLFLKTFLPEFLFRKVFGWGFRRSMFSALPPKTGSPATHLPNVTDNR